MDRERIGITIQMLDTSRSIREVRDFFIGLVMMKWDQRRVVVSHKVIDVSGTCIPPCYLESCPIHLKLRVYSC